MPTPKERLIAASNRIVGSRPVTSIASRAIDGTRVIAYHDVADRRAFERQLELFGESWDLPRIDAEAPHLNRRRGSVVLTFDDGHADVVENALPVLRDAGVWAVMFVCPGLVEASMPYWWDVVGAASPAQLAEADARVPAGADPRTYLKSVPDAERRRVVASLEQAGRPVSQVATATALREWLDAGMDIANHTWDHPCLDQCSLEEQRAQIVRAHEWLTEFTGHEPTTFAYPNGDWTPAAEAVLVELGYTDAFLFDHRVSKPSDHALRQSRLRLDADADLRRARSVVSGVHSLGFAVRRRLGPS